MKKNIAMTFAVVGVVLAAAAFCAAQETDPIDAIRRGGTADMPLDRARTTLINGGEQYVNRIVEVLTEGGVNVSEHARLNFAIVLGEIARNVDTPRLRQGLLLCTNDTNAGVRFWGLRGLSRIQQLPAADLAAVVRRFVDRNQPRYLRLMAADVAAQKRLVRVGPDIFEALRLNVATYETARNSAVEDMLGGRIRAAAPDMPREDYMMDDFYMMMEDPDMMRHYRGMGMPTPAPTMRPAAGAPDVYEDEPLTSEEARLAIVESQAQIELLQGLADELEKKDEVVEIRRIGRALERMTANMRENNNNEGWGFGTRPPWELDEAAQTALGWFENNRARFE